MIECTPKALAGGSDYIAIDTETYYDSECSIKELGLHQYVRHPSFEVLLISAATDTEVICERPDRFPWDLLSGRKIIAHNAAFDRAVLRTIPEAPVTSVYDWMDTAGMCAYHQHPRSLKEAAAVVLGMSLTKDVRDHMKGKTLGHLSSRERLDVIEYCKRDALAALKLFQALKSTTPDDELYLMSLAIDQGDFGVQIDRKRLIQGLNTLDAACLNAARQIPWFGKSKPNSTKAIKEHFEGLDVVAPSSTAKNDPQCLEWIRNHPEHAGIIQDLQKYRTLSGLQKDLNKMKGRLRSDGVLPFELKYFGSEITGRFAGSGGVNMLNHRKDSAEGVNVRHLIIPREGYQLAVVDLANIEVRTGAYLIGDEPLLDMIRDGVDVYEAHARATMGYSDRRPLREADPEKRNLAKTRVLGLSFGQGPKKLSQNMDIGLGEAQNIVKSFRRTSPLIVNRWKKLEQGLFSATVGSNRTYSNKLPSNRVLRYFDVARAPGERGRPEIKASMTRGAGPRRVPFHGGKLYENECQAMARDIFMHGLLAVSRADIRVLFTVHDELVAEVPTTNAEEYLREIVRLMTLAPEWAISLPLSAEGQICNYYQK